MRIGHIELLVKDIIAARAFYEQTLGFALVADQGQTVWLKCGEVELLLRPGHATPRADDYQHAPSGIILYTDDLEQTAERLQARGLVFRGNDGPGCLTFCDVDGNWWQLVNPEHA